MAVIIGTVSTAYLESDQLSLINILFSVDVGNERKKLDYNTIRFMLFGFPTVLPGYELDLEKRSLFQ